MGHVCTVEKIRTGRASSWTTRSSIEKAAESAIATRLLVARAVRITASNAGFPSMYNVIAVGENAPTRRIAPENTTRSAKVVAEFFEYVVVIMYVDMAKYPIAAREELSYRLFPLKRGNKR